MSGECRPGPRIKCGATRLGGVKHGATRLEGADGVWIAVYSVGACDDGIGGWIMILLIAVIPRLDRGIQSTLDTFLHCHSGLDPESTAVFIIDNLIAVDFWILDRSPGQAKFRKWSP